MESDLHMYIQSSDRAWSPILLNIILIETDLYLSGRVPDLPSQLATSAKKILDVNQTHFMITARPRLASRDFVSLNLNAVVWYDQHPT